MSVDEPFVPKSFFQCNREADGNTRKLNGESGPSHEVKVRELSEIVLKLEETAKLGMQDEYTGTAG
jgi:hypothetical protein